MEKKYRFYGWKNADVAGVGEYAAVKDPRMLYDLLSGIWCAETCAPRMRERWSADNKTLGQCSITAFLAQDVFGGKVYGIPNGDGSFHCFNVVGDCTFDLTSEQFGARKLDYSACTEQSRDAHFVKAEKRERYEYLRDRLRKAIDVLK